MANGSLHNVAADFKAIANSIKIDLEDPGELLIVAHLFDRARDLAERGADEANKQAETLIFRVLNGGAQ